MENNTQIVNQCHVCQHLGERECKYTSHKKYKNQKGNESFRVGNIDWSPSKKKPQSSYLKSLKQNEIQFEFPSQIPLPNKSIQKIRNFNDQSTKIFQRTLIEKVIEKQTPQKMNFSKKYEQKRQFNHDPQTGQFNINQINRHSQSIGISEEQKDNKTQTKTKRPASFLKYQATSYKKQIQQPQITIRPQMKSSILESNKKQLNLKIIQTNNQTPIQVKLSKYNFQYGKNNHKEQVATKQYLSKKQTESSFIVDDHKLPNQTGQMLISRVNDKQRSSFYMNNIFKEYSTIKEQKKLQESPLKPELSEFNQQSESKSIIQNLQLNRTNPPSPRPVISTQRPSISKNEEIRVKFQYPSGQQTQRKLKSSNVSPYDHSKYSISTAQQENPYSVNTPSKYLNNLPNQTPYVENKRVSFNLSSSPRRHQIMLYPIYPVYEIIYQLVSVRSNQIDSQFYQHKSAILNEKMKLNRIEQKLSF